MKLSPLPYPIYKKINSKDLNVKSKIIKLLEENIGLNHHNLELGNSFLDITPKGQMTKEKNKLDFNKIKNLCDLPRK